MTRLLSFALTLAATAALGDEERTLLELTAGWGTDLTDIQLHSETLEPGLHAIRGAGGAILASIGGDGVLIVDDQFAQGVPVLKRKLEQLGGSGVDYVINTHWHFDHADGNPALGADGARIVAHANSRQQMTQRTKVEYVGMYYMQPPYPPHGLPQITFEDGMTLHFNGQRIDIAHFGPAHTTGDAVVYFRQANVVHVGDLYTARYPYIDAGNGGSLAGLIAVCTSLAEWIDDETRIVPGHAPTARRDDLLAYIDMLEATYAKLDELKRAGRTLEEALAAGVTAEFDPQRGNPALFLTMAYRSLAGPD